MDDNRELRDEETEAEDLSAEDETPAEETADEGEVVAEPKEGAKPISADLIRGHINTIILRTLDERDKYGYEIINDIDEKTRGQYEMKQPTLYSALKRLENQGYIKAYWKTNEVSEGGRRKYFTLTELGRSYAKQNQAEWEYSRTIIDSLISDRSFDFTQPAPTPVDFHLLKKSVTRVYTGGGKGECGEGEDDIEEKPSKREQPAEEKTDERSEYARRYDEMKNLPVRDEYTRFTTADLFVGQKGETKEAEEKGDNTEGAAEQKKEGEPTLESSAGNAAKDEQSGQAAATEAQKSQPAVNDAADQTATAAAPTPSPEVQTAATGTTDGTPAYPAGGQQAAPQFAEQNVQGAQVNGYAQPPAGYAQQPVYIQQAPYAQQPPAVYGDQYIQSATAQQFAPQYAQQPAPQNAAYPPVQPYATPPRDMQYADPAAGQVPPYYGQYPVYGQAQPVNAFSEQSAAQTVNAEQSEQERMRELTRSRLFSEEAAKRKSDEDEEKRAKLEEQRRIAHENYVKLTEPPKRERGTVPSYEDIDTQKLIYTNRPETERDYKKLVANIYGKAQKGRRMPDEAEGEYPAPPVQENVQTAATENVNYAQPTARAYPSYAPSDPVYDKAKDDGLKVNTSVPSSRPRSARSTTFNKGNALFASSVIVAIVLLIEFAVCMALRKTLNVDIMYPVTFVILAAAVLAVFGGLYIGGYGRGSVRPATHSYISLCIVLTIISILIVTLVSFLLKINFASPIDVAVKLIIPAITALNITIFGLSYYFISK